MRMMKMRTRIVAGDDKDEEDEGYGYDLYKIAPPKHKLCSGGEGPNNACKNLVEPLLVDSTKVCELQSWGATARNLFMIENRASYARCALKRKEC